MSGLVALFEKLVENFIVLINRYILKERLLILQKSLPVLPYWKNGIVDLIGNTPMIKLPHLSKLTGCDILVGTKYFIPWKNSEY